MAREITHEARGPIYLDEDDVDPEKGDVAVCMCGLSEEYPFCDGSHRATEDEAEGVVYKYGDDSAGGERRVVEELVLADDETDADAGTDADDETDGDGRADVE